MLQAAMGLTIDGARGQVTFSHTVLPAFLDRVRIDGLRVGDGCLDLQLERHAHDVSITVLNKEGRVEVVIRK
jgi:hypothetical protein